MMDKFLYVFTEDARDQLLSSNYNLLQSDNDNHRYVFENREDMKFDLMEASVIPSNTLTF